MSYQNDSRSDETTGDFPVQTWLYVGHGLDVFFKVGISWIYIKTENATVTLFIKAH